MGLGKHKYRNGDLSKVPFQTARPETDRIHLETASETHSGEAMLQLLLLPRGESQRQREGERDGRGAQKAFLKGQSHK